MDSRVKNSNLINTEHVIDVEDSNLNRALKQRNWDEVERILAEQPKCVAERLVTARLTSFSETPLVAAVKAGKGISFIRKLVDLMPKEALVLPDYFGSTALHAAAELGNIKAAKLFVKKNRDLPNIWDVNGFLPIHLATKRGHREMILYLFSVTRAEGDGFDPLKEADGVTLIQFAVTAGFYDVALSVVEHNQKLGLHANEIVVPLELLANDPSAFPSGMNFNAWEYFIYCCVPKKLAMLDSMKGRSIFLALQWRRCCGNWFSRACLELHLFLWRALEVLVPPLKRLRHAKSMHCQAIELVKRVCEEIKLLDDIDASRVLAGPFILGAQNGIHEIVKEILESFPPAIRFMDEENHSVFHLAVMYRHEKIFKIVNRHRGQYKFSLSLLSDIGKNNLLHLVGYKPYQDGLELSSGAVLRMQRELQWYKEVEKFVLPQERKSKNAEGKTPFTIFNEHHRALAAYETQWMIGMATSCTVAASLIATVAFAAAITVPGGNTSSGGPVFAGETAFVLFAVTDALALMTSVNTVISFLSIFTSRYAVQDFLYALPNRLIIGLISLFLSVTSLMIAFGCTMFLMATQNSRLLIVPIVSLACVPVIFFSYMQLPPLVNMIRSTYGHSIFG